MNSLFLETSTERRRALATIRQHPFSIWVLWAIALFVLFGTLRYATVDPAFIVLFIDPELAAALVLVAIALLRADVARFLSLSLHRLVRLRHRLHRERLPWPGLAPIWS